MIRDLSKLDGAGCLLAAAFAVLGGCTPTRAAVPEVVKPVASVPTPQPTVQPSSPPVDPNSIAPAVIARCKAATVLIFNYEGGQLTATGTGFVIDDGATVVTNKHVV